MHIATPHLFLALLLCGIAPFSSAQTPNPDCFVHWLARQGRLRADEDSHRERNRGEVDRSSCRR